MVQTSKKWGGELNYLVDTVTEIDSYRKKEKRVKCSRCRNRADESALNS